MPARLGRLFPALIVVMTVGVGLWVRSPAFPGADIWAQRLGTALWAFALLFALRTVFFRRSSIAIGLAALATAWAVELLQVTGVSRWASARVPAARLVLGSDFDPADLLWLAIGVGCAWVLDRLVHDRA